MTWYIRKIYSYLPQLSLRLRMIRAKRRNEKKNFHCFSSLIYTFHLIIDWGRSHSVLLVQKNTKKCMKSIKMNLSRYAPQKWKISPRQFFKLKLKTVSSFQISSLLLTKKYFYTRFYDIFFFFAKKVEHDRDNVKEIILFFMIVLTLHFQMQQLTCGEVHWWAAGANGPGEALAEQYSAPCL